VIESLDLIILVLNSHRPAGIALFFKETPPATSLIQVPRLRPSLFKISRGNRALASSIGKGPMREMYFVVLLPDGTVAVPRLENRM
jgi:hypothetical protein